MSDQNLLDEQLVERVQRGDKAAFNLLVKKYQHKVVNLVARYVNNPGDVPDVAQEAFIKAYRALPTFRGESALHLVVPNCREHGEELSHLPGAQAAQQ